MRRISYKSYGLLGILIALLLHLPSGSVQSIRCRAVAIVAPPWQALHGALFFLEQLPSLIAAHSFRGAESQGREIYALERENHALRQQVEQLKHQVSLQDGLFQLLQKTQGFDKDHPFFQRRASEIFRMVNLQMESVEAKVIYRDSSSWTSSVWVNAGEKNNRILGQKVIAPNSPVVIGSYVVGIIDFVGEKRSRVRLVSHSSIVPAVRAVRKQNSSPDLYLAKGELYGASLPLWRSRGQLLKGVGFNYDFADAEGPALHLITGEPFHRLTGKPKALIAKDDFLVTTGLDGVFPSGLTVAQVVEVAPLQEGSSSYEITAQIACPDFDELRWVSILPPIDEI